MPEYHVELVLSMGALSYPKMCFVSSSFMLFLVGKLCTYTHAEAFCTAGATIVSGAVAERVKSPTYAAYALIMTSFIYPVVVAWTWGGGWLATVFDVSYMDFAGGLVFGIPNQASF